MLSQLALPFVLGKEIELEEVLVTPLLATLLCLLLVQQLTKILGDKGACWHRIKAAHTPPCAIWTSENLCTQRRKSEGGGATRHGA